MHNESADMYKIAENFWSLVNKQSRCRSDCSLRAVWSRSTLSASIFMLNNKQIPHLIISFYLCIRPVLITYSWGTAFTVTKKFKSTHPSRAVEIPCPTCPTWSHFIQDKLKISIYLSLNKCKICYKVNNMLYFIFRLIVMSSHVALRTVLILISWLLQKPADLDLHCLQESWYLHGFILFSKV